VTYIKRLCDKTVYVLTSLLTYLLTHVRPQPTRRTSWKLVANPGWQPGFPTSFQLVRLVGCGLYCSSTTSSGLQCVLACIRCDIKNKTTAAVHKSKDGFSVFT